MHKSAVLAASAALGLAFAYAGSVYSAPSIYPARRKASPFRGGDIRRTITGIFAFNWAFVELRYTAAEQR